MRLFHRTSNDAAREIRRTGTFTSKENTGDVYFSNRRNGHAAVGYGNAVVTVNVHASQCVLDDEFPNGERHYRVKASAIRPDQIVAVTTAD